MPTRTRVPFYYKGEELIILREPILPKSIRCNWCKKVSGDEGKLWFASLIYGYWCSLKCSDALWADYDEHWADGLDARDLSEDDFRALFLQRVKRLEKETLFYSDLSRQIMHADYQKIIGMGPRVLPLIFEQYFGDSLIYWNWALVSILGAEPHGVVPNETNMDQLCELWKEWARDRGYPSGN